MPQSTIKFRESNPVTLKRKKPTTKTDNKKRLGKTKKNVLSCTQQKIKRKKKSKKRKRKRQYKISLHRWLLKKF